ncbi:quaternary ammonium compound efflux SMR transporter SugE [Pseudomonas sp. OIL-1]|uniref:quaternary ammonium compound efflux SMR transporter SugE n=1 Tax=Pseudomonas sp. OIL-1 TaxID=2706126 RepID=UPI0013A7189E|nr:quaternary ammonium compound efflux SMR transporter SugE [Pseudomonas sp. OIL-1]QIB49817.1 quaternary ammonium compound efflux SMR transporter SugE [Pseudomonas sp. OIL-1]
MNWILLFLAGLLEVVWAVGLKYTEGFTRLWPSIGTLLAMIISFGLLAVAMKTLPLGTAYAVWVGIGVIGSALLGVFLFAEPMPLGRLVSLALILMGIIGLKMADSI